jgi:hypothetical protein
MGYRMSLACGCDESHFFLELDDDFATAIWSDNHGALKRAGIATLAAIGDADEDDDEEEEHVSIEPEAFSRWLDQVAAARAAIYDQLKGGRSKPWTEVEFARELPGFRELAEHARAAGTTIEAGWA